MSMDSVFLAVSKMIPKEEVVDRLSIALSKFKIDPTDENKSEMLMLATMLVIRLGSDHKSLEDMIKDHDRIKKLDETFKNTQQ
jgi:hypothetical protein